MGIYDREYVRREPGGFSLGGGRSVVVNLVLLNVAVFLFNMLFFTGSHRFIDGIATHVGDLSHPLYWWRFLSSGFAHDPRGITHILFNMYGLWLFGRDIEGVYGPREFLRVYLAMIVFSSVAWAGLQAWQGDWRSTSIGASGAVTGVVVLFVMHFPHRQLLIFFAIPAPAWLVGVFLIGYDVVGTMQLGNGMEPVDAPRIAHSAHLAGAAFAAAYRYWGWNLGSWLPGRGSRFSRLVRRPRLRVHDPGEPETDLSRRVDEILEKISTKGEESLTKEERRTLEEASRRYQRRRR